jgi:RHS repeat-associated protein
VLTEFLYSGEQFDSKIGQQYLRQRYYNPTTGRFNRLDPFFGNLDDPQSLHKYLYTHADPVNGIDPNGLMSVGSMMSSIVMSMRMAATNAFF